MSAAPSVAPFADDSAAPAVRGFLHRPAEPGEAALVITHGAGSNCQAPILRTLATAFAESGVAVLRCDLPFRQARPHGPPYRGDDAKDRAGLKRAVEALRQMVAGRIFLGGVSYGGRQASMLVAEEPELVEGLLLLSYPLHPPGKAGQLRTAHFPKLQVPALFVHGSRDPFGSIGEMTSSLSLIPGRTKLLVMEGAGHGLSTGKRNKAEAASRDVVVKPFKAYFKI